MFEFLLGYWIGKDSQKDPKGTLIALMIVPPGLLLAFWAFYAFIDFSKSVWVGYQFYSSMISLEYDFIFIVALFIANQLTKKYNESKMMSHKIIKTLEGTLSAVVLPWVVFDILVKIKFFERLQAQIGGTQQDLGMHPVITSHLFSLDLTFYQVIVGGLALGGLIAPFAFIAIVTYFYFESKKELPVCTEKPEGEE